MLRLEVLRLANRPDQFDEAAIDYCVTYEVSPPSWERAKCTVRIGGSGLSTQSPPPSEHTPGVPMTVIAASQNLSPSLLQLSSVAPEQLLSTSSQISSACATASRAP